MLYSVAAFERRSFKDVRREVIDLFERRYLAELLQRHHYDVSALVGASGLSRRRLYSLIRKHRLKL
jgi:DNA-binding NtrC family response regulator